MTFLYDGPPKVVAGYPYLGSRELRSTWGATVLVPGDYTFDGVATDGTFVVRSGSVDLTWYDGKSSFATADTVAVPVGQTVGITVRVPYP